MNPSEKISLSSATDAFETLKNTIFKHVRVGLLHGKLTSEKKEMIMKEFHNHQLDLLSNPLAVKRTL